MAIFTRDNGIVDNPACLILHIVLVNDNCSSLRSVPPLIGGFRMQCFPRKAIVGLYSSVPDLLGPNDVIACVIARPCYRLAADVLTHADPEG